jgi:hypothetical protein
MNKSTLRIWNRDLRFTSRIVWPVLYRHLVMFHKNYSLKSLYSFEKVRKLYVTTVPTERNLTPERTRGSLPGLRVRSGFAIWVRFTHSCVKRTPAFILLPASSAPCIFQKHLHGSDFSHCWFCCKINKYITTCTKMEDIDKLSRIPPYIRT